MYHVGIDVSKAKLDICLLADGLTVNEKQNHYPMASHRQRQS
ncbi:TPA: hypothetical protein ACMX4R_004338 [Yersinia enterocolitica]